MWICLAGESWNCRGALRNPRKILGRLLYGNGCTAQKADLFSLSSLGLFLQHWPEHCSRVSLKHLEVSDASGLLVP